jgi:hypothetical protein
MKDFFKKTISIFLVQAIFLGQANSSSRIDDLILEDNTKIISDLYIKKIELKGYAKEMLNIENKIKHTRKGESVYLKLEVIAGSLIAMGIVFSSYRAYFPPGFRAMLGAYLAVNGFSRGFIKLTPVEVKKLHEEIVILNKNYIEYAASLDKKLATACLQINTSPICDL